MMLINRGELDIAHPHFFRSYRPVPPIARSMIRPELIVVLPGYDPGGEAAMNAEA